MNYDNLTPFMLCGMCGKTKMFQRLIERRKLVMWTYGPVTHSRIDVVGFDVPAGYNPKVDGFEENSIVAMVKKYFGDIKEAVSSRSGAMKREAKDVSINRLTNTEDLIEYLASGRGGDCFYVDEQSDKPNLGAIEHICAKDRLDMLALDDVKAIIDLKWERVGFWMFLRRAFYYLVVTILLSLIVCMYNLQSSSTSEGWVAWAYFPAVFILLAMKIIAKLPEILRRGFSYWGWNDPYVRGASRLDNVCSTIEFVSFGVACLLKILQFFEVLSAAEADVSIRVLIMISVITSWVYLYFFLLGSTQTGTFVIIVSTILSKDMPVFFTLYVVLLCGFGSSFALLSLEEGGTVASGFGHFFSVLWSLFVYTVTGGNYDGFDGKFFPVAGYTAPFWLYVILTAMFNLIILFLMLNLLVAMMTQTYESIFEQSQHILYRERYNIMCSLERGLSDKARFDLGKRYGTWIHVNLDSQMEQKDELEEKQDAIRSGSPVIPVEGETEGKKKSSMYRFFFEMETISDTSEATKE
jgi:hypothetical protein